MATSARVETKETWADAARALVRHAPVVLPTAIVAFFTIRAVLAKVGHPAATLDDSYIHFQYARAFVEGHPMRYQGGEPISSGATSQLWPAMLAPFYAIGFRGQALMWPAWAISFGCLAGLAHEAHRLAKGLVSDTMAVAAAAMVLAFGGHVWGAASGMEVVPFAWLLARGARRGVEWCEDTGARKNRDFVELVALACAAPLMRPEGSLVSIGLAAVVAGYPADRRAVARLKGIAPLVGLALTPLLLLAMTGKTTTSTTQVKLAVGNPYHPLVPTFLGNARTLVQTILNGEVWSVEFLPKGGAKVALVSLFAVAVRGAVTKKHERAFAVLAFALAMFVPCAYITFLWNRLRYLWPFATGWFVALACLGETLASLARRLSRRFELVGPIFGFGVAGMLAMRLDWVIDDVATSASGIDRQHGQIAAYVEKNLPPDARVGLNDTGAIAYFGGRKTFDIVGLTTPSEAPYWIGGSASRFEHYEHVFATTPHALPSHFAVYPEWMGNDAILGETLFEATVRDSSILGGQTMKLVRADYGLLGSGEAPHTAVGAVIDALDVADLESERAHGYDLFAAQEGEQAVDTFGDGNDPERLAYADGARTNRRHERFVVSLSSRPHRMVVRLRAASDGDGDVGVTVRAAGKEVGTFTASTSRVEEETVELPADACADKVAISLEAKGGALTVHHYWFAAR